MRILVADQDGDQRAKLTSYIASLGAHTLQEALTVRDVMDQCRGKCPDLIFVDSMLSGTPGIEIIRQIRQLGGHAVWAPISYMGTSLTEQDIQQAIEAGADDYLEKPIPNLRILAKVKSAERHLNLKEEVFTVAHNLVVANRALESVVTQDTLTGIGNSNSFDDALERDWFAAKQKATPLVLIMCNLDYFQGYNQAYGANKGDTAIKQVAEALKSAMPSGDAGSIARIAGETFSILLPNTNAQDGLKAAEKFRAAVDALQIPHINSGCSDHLTMSFGVAAAEPGHYTTPWDLKENADFALYQAKHYGRNRSYLAPATEKAS